MARAEQKKSHKKHKTQKQKVQISKGMSPERMNKLFVFLIFVFVLILYGSTIRNKYALDDHLVAYPNEQIAQGFRAIPEIFTTRYATEADLSYGYRPIVKSTFAIEFGIFNKWRPGVSHFINLLLYALTGYILYLLLKRLFRYSNLLFPFLITMLFLAHPIHTEVVASLKNRDEILSLLFSLATILSMFKFLDTKKPYHVFLSVLYFIIAILSKRSAGVFILVIPLILYFFTSVKIRTILFLFGAGVFILAATVVIPSFFLSGNIRPTEYWENPLFLEENFGIKLGTGLYILLYYLRLLIFPHPLRFYYGFDIIPLVGPLNIWAIISFLFYAGIFIFAIYKLRSKHILSFVILFYLFNVAAYSNILFPSPGIVAERFIYPASIGFCIALVYFIFRIFKADPISNKITKPTRNWILLVAMIFLIPYSIHTFVRGKDWKNKRTLYAKDIKYLDRSVKANTLYASEMYDRFIYNNKFAFNLDEIQEQSVLIPQHFKRAIELYPANYKALNNLGSFYAYSMEEYDKALPYFLEASEIRPDIYEPLFNIAYNYQKLKNYSEAERYYNKVLEIRPDYHLIRAYLGDLYFEQGDYASGIRINQEIMKLDPDSDLPYLKIGDYFFTTGDTATAINYWEQAVDKRPQWDMCQNLSEHYKHKGDMEKSKYFYDMAVRARTGGSE